MLSTIIVFLIWLLVLGLIFWIAVWVLGLLGIAIPPRVIQIVAAIVFLIILLWFVQAFVSGGHLPGVGLVR